MAGRFAVGGTQFAHNPFYVEDGVGEGEAVTFAGDANGLASSSLAAELVEAAVERLVVGAVGVGVGFLFGLSDRDVAAKRCENLIDGRDKMGAGAFPFEAKFIIS